MPMSWAKSRLNRWMGRESGPAPDTGSASFRLMLDQLHVGTLRLQDGAWHFEYTDDFRRRSDLRPISAFPDVNKVYASRELWPFFALRIPSLKQPAVEKVVKTEHIDPKDEVGLLRRFGKRTVFNPFELIAV